MQKNQALFILGSPGSGKDVVIRDISSNFNIVEFTSTQIDEMLSDDASFKRAKFEKQNVLLETKSIIVTANSFDLNFVVTKQILEAIGYSTHLILVEADLNVSYERLQNRKNLKESLDRISTGNSNKQSIIGLFDSYVFVDNSKSLDLSESREFISGILDELSFKTELTLEDILKPKSIKKKLSGTVPGPAAVVIPILAHYEIEEELEKILSPKKKKLKSVTPGSETDATGEQITGWTSHMEVYDAMLSPIATGPMQQIKPSIAGNDLRSDQDKQRTKDVFNKIKKIHFKKAVIPYGIG
jgi:hypothetical protein